MIEQNCKQEREEIAQIAMMLTDREKLYYLLGTARGLLKIEAEQTANQGRFTTSLRSD